MKLKILVIISILSVYISLLPTQLISAQFDLSERAESRIISDTDNDYFVLLPQVGILFNLGGYLNNEAKYSGLIRRIIELEVARYKRFSILFMFDERHIFQGEHSYWYEPYKIQYFMDYINLKWRHHYGSLNFVIDHICYNIIDKNDSNPEQLRWYGFGIRWESHGMQIGYKNSGVQLNSNNKFEILNNLEYSLYASKAIVTQRFNYNALVKGILRYDICYLFNVIPYISVGFDSIIDDRVRFDHHAEFGTRVHFKKLDITPYIKYTYKHDVDTYRGLTTDFWLIGLQMEALLGNVKEDTGMTNKDIPLLFPEVHVVGGYGRNFNSDYFGYTTDILFAIDLIRIRRVSFFINNQIIHNSKTGPFNLFPRYLTYIYKTGISYDIDSVIQIADLYYYQEQRHEGNSFKGFYEAFEIIGVEAKSRGMKTGNKNCEVGLNKGNNVRFLNKLDWKLSMGKIIRESNYCYQWDFNGKIRWDILQYQYMVPYISAESHLIKGDNIDYEYGSEAGIRLVFGITLIIYYRNRYRINVISVGSGEEWQHMIGLCLEK